MPVINGEIDALLKKELEFQSNSKLNQSKVDRVKIIRDILEAYYMNTGVKVKLVFDKGFKNFASIIMTGNDINICDKRLLKILNNDVAYMNIYIENKKMCVELTFSGLTR